MSSITEKILRKIHKPTANKMCQVLVKKYQDKDLPWNIIILKINVNKILKDSLLTF